jgi:hypothetical protein
LTKQPEGFDDEVRVTRHLKSGLDDLEARTAHLSINAADAIDRAEGLLRQLGATVPSRPRTRSRTQILAEPLELRPWAELVSDAQGLDADVEALLSGSEMDALHARLKAIGTAAVAEHQMDLTDAGIAALAAILAGMVDILLVQVPAHPGFLGSTAHEGGWLSNFVKGKVGELLPADSIRRLERKFPVPFDAAISSGLQNPIAGLGPTTHRFHSPGHDPLLGWIIGTADVLRGTFTAISKHGQLIIQHSPTARTLDSGLSFFERILHGLHQVGGHLLSDVATPAGLPAPLMSLAPLLQFGSIGPKGYTIGEVARQMYRSGYDFRHFVAGSVPSVLIEVVVRGAWVVRRLNEGKPLSDAVPLASHPKLQKTLLAAHAGAAAINAGKVYFTGPLGLNWSQWMALSRYAVPQTLALITGKAASTREAAVRQSLEDEMTELSLRIHSGWQGAAALPTFRI